MRRFILVIDGQIISVLPPERTPSQTIHWMTIGQGEHDCVCIYEARGQNFILHKSNKPSQAPSDWFMPPEGVQLSTAMTPEGNARLRADLLQILRTSG